MLVAHLATAS